MSVETFELKTVVCPLWAPAKGIRELFGIAPTALGRLVEAGEVRKRKVGDSDQAGAVFRVADVLEWLEADG